ncbi:YCF48-related protein [Lacimicrobium sp. SS2-24]|uniref:WD40/YVTN/BNR-like repeat-containing protein n=1 Tax=Lacimicrobium sp. SS2-24 TaxID=2005569 RepID=UPI000B4A685C|nr:YCF48-related protein [Lacimicrobium sp. SS2-24]
MKKNILPLFSAVLTFTASVLADVTPQASFQAPLASKSLLLDISRVGNKQQLIAVGERGHVLMSEDGKNWQQKQVPITATLTAVFARDDHIWAVGHDAVILYSNDGGNNWQIQNFVPELQKPLMDVLFFDDQHGIAIGAYGLFYRTEDGGQTWNKEAHVSLLNEMDVEYLESLKEENMEFYQSEMEAILPHLNRVSVAGDRLLLAGEAGTLAISEDQGRNWQRMDVDYFGSFFDVQQTEEGRILAAGLRGNLFEYADEQWQEIDTGISSTLNSIISVAGQAPLIVANKGYYLWLEDTLRVEQTDDEEALVSGLSFNDKVLVVSEAGIQELQK